MQSAITGHSFPELDWILDEGENTVILLLLASELFATCGPKQLTSQIAKNGYGFTTP
jgi:hypothetical protein